MKGQNKKVIVQIGMYDRKRTETIETNERPLKGSGVLIGESNKRGEIVVLIEETQGALLRRITKYATDDYAGRPAMYIEAMTSAIANKEKIDIVCVPVADYGSKVTYAVYRISAPKSRADITKKIPAYSYDLVMAAIGATKEPLKGYEAHIKAFVLSDRGYVLLSKHYRTLI